MPSLCDRTPTESAVLALKNAISVCNKKVISMTITGKIENNTCVI